MRSCVFSRKCKLGCTNLLLKRHLYSGNFSNIRRVRLVKSKHFNCHQFCKYSQSQNEPKEDNEPNELKEEIESDDDATNKEPAKPSPFQDKPRKKSVVSGMMSVLKTIAFGTRTQTQIQPKNTKKLNEANLRIIELQNELRLCKENLIKSEARLINTKRIQKKACEEASAYSNKRFAEDMLAVFDAMDSTLKHNYNVTDTGTDIKQLVDGVQMTHKTLLGSFEKNKITIIESLHLPFDPSVHDALFQIRTAEHSENTVLQVLSNGFQIEQQILRSAKVGVSVLPAIKDVEPEQDLEDGSEDTKTNM